MERNDPDQTILSSQALAEEEESCQELDEAADELAAIIIEFYRQWKQL